VSEDVAACRVHERSTSVRAHTTSLECIVERSPAKSATHWSTASLLRIEKQAIAARHNDIILLTHLVRYILCTTLQLTAPTTAIDRLLYLSRLPLGHCRVGDMRACANVMTHYPESPSSRLFISHSSKLHNSIRRDVPHSCTVCSTGASYPLKHDTHKQDVIDCRTLNCTTTTGS